jgi:hypothetical protein
MTDTYIISDPDDTRFGKALGMITNAITGRQTAYYGNSVFVVIGEPLKSCCDSPVSDGPCGCEIEGE